MNTARAIAIYEESFRRVIEYITLCRINGDIAEFGSYNGFTAHMIALLLKEYQWAEADSHLYLYDSWEGFPAPTGNDLECPEVKINDAWKGGDCKVDASLPESLHKSLVETLGAAHRVHLIKGFYDKVVSAHTLPAQISFLHIDCDLYESTIFVLKSIVENNRLAKGAVIAFDDYNNNLASNDYGERKAFRDSGLFSKCEPWFTYGWSGQTFLYNGS